jgi:hypothetical protein
MPDNEINWEIDVNTLWSKKINISKKVEIWNIELSNYLYKFY